MAEEFAHELQPKFIVKLKNTFWCMYHFLELESAKMINERYFGVSALKQIKFSFFELFKFPNNAKNKRRSWLNQCYDKSETKSYSNIYVYFVIHSWIPVSIIIIV